ncbi:hypothetical protein B0H16DRAFT_1455158 [Mycena metata]|uniref:Uncharacterized protein n=1 Tax=Mycena metata TaxID=1033252 RepID=A0AAD7JIA1_9AGAR|nr:hypothetical protein B0H16DRAFT_1455158 [Mycena metata]
MNGYGRIEGVVRRPRTSTVVKRELREVKCLAGLSIREIKVRLGCRTCRWSDWRSWRFGDLEFRVPKCTRLVLLSSPNLKGGGFGLVGMNTVAVVTGGTGTVSGMPSRPLRPVARDGDGRPYTVYHRVMSTIGLNPIQIGRCVDEQAVGASNDAPQTMPDFRSSAQGGGQDAETILKSLGHSISSSPARWTQQMRGKLVRCEQELLAECSRKQMLRGSCTAQWRKLRRLGRRVSGWRRPRLTQSGGWGETGSRDVKCCLDERQFAETEKKDHSGETRSSPLPQLMDGRSQQCRPGKTLEKIGSGGKSSPQLDTAVTTLASSPARTSSIFVAYVTRSHEGRPQYGDGRARLLDSTFASVDVLGRAQCRSLLSTIDNPFKEAGRVAFITRYGAGKLKLSSYKSAHSQSWEHAYILLWTQDPLFRDDYQRADFVPQDSCCL